MICFAYCMHIIADGFVTPFRRIPCNHPPQQTLHPEPPSLPSSQAFREEGQISRYVRGKTKNLTRGMLPRRAAAGPRLNPCGVGALPPTMLFLEGLLFVADLLRVHRKKRCVCALRWDFESRRNSDRCEALKASVPSL